LAFVSTVSPAAARGRILIVEDDPDAALYAMHVLGNRGRFEVTHTADAAAALRLAATKPWDLVLTEVKVAGMTGLELLEGLREAAPGLPVAVITGHVIAGDLMAALRSRADEYLIKPVGVDRLIATAAALTARGPRRLNGGPAAR
jgi:DNA-binding response OmpR family regulator